MTEYADIDFGAGSRSGLRFDEHRVELLDSTKDLATGNNPFREIVYGDGGGTELDAILDPDDARSALVHADVHPDAGAPDCGAEAVDGALGG